jgi:hypothetical protein
MIDSATAIKNFERRVIRRELMLSAFDHLAAVLLIGGIISAALALYIRLRPADLSVWKITFAVFGIVTILAAARWALTRRREAAFKIDRALRLEDRIASAAAIISGGGPRREMEQALLDDAAGRLAGVDQSLVAPFRIQRWHALALIGVIALVVAVMVPQKVIPGAEALAEERADIQSAGEELEQAAGEIEKQLPPESETARLAREQAELGRALRRSSDTRAEALKKINELEGRIRQRRDLLADTRADEIVNLAERRLRSALSEKPKKPKDETVESSNTNGVESNKPAENRSDDKSIAENKATVKPQSGNSNNSQTLIKKNETVAESEVEQMPADSKPAVDKANQPPDEMSSDKSEQIEQPESQTPTGKKNQSNQKPSNEKQEDQMSESGLDGKPNPLTGEVTKFASEQAAKALPALSDQLMKKAEQMRAGELTPEDIKRLQQAAEKLADDLAAIAQSKEFQQSLQQLARKVDPKQLEQVAREIMKNEKLRQELEAAARMLAENRKVREMVAGLAQKFQQNRPQNDDEPLRGMQAGRESTGDGRSSNKGKGSQTLELGPRAEQLKGQGKEARLAGQMQKKPGGEYLYLQSKPGAGAARAPYSSAYPQYRREAERAVERSQVPAQMRSMVRNYFDVINPDAQKKP